MKVGIAISSSHQTITRSILPTIMNKITTDVINTVESGNCQHLMSVESCELDRRSKQRAPGRSTTDMQARG